MILIGKWPNNISVICKWKRVSNFCVRIFGRISIWINFLYVISVFCNCVLVNFNLTLEYFVMGLISKVSCIFVFCISYLELTQTVFVCVHSKRIINYFIRKLCSVNVSINGQIMFFLIVFHYLVVATSRVVLWPKIFGSESGDFFFRWKKYWFWGDTAEGHLAKMRTIGKNENNRKQIGQPWLLVFGEPNQVRCFIYRLKAPYIRSLIIK